MSDRLPPSDVPSSQSDPAPQATSQRVEDGPWPTLGAPHKGRLGLMLGLGVLGFLPLYLWAPVNVTTIALGVWSFWTILVSCLAWPSWRHPHFWAVVTMGVVGGVAIDLLIGLVAHPAWS